MFRGFRISTLKVPGSNRAEAKGRMIAELAGVQPIRR